MTWLIVGCYAICMFLFTTWSLSQHERDKGLDDIFAVVLISIVWPLLTFGIVANSLAVKLRKRREYLKNLTPEQKFNNKLFKVVK
jgi:hypothetical protein